MADLGEAAMIKNRSAATGEERSNWLRSLAAGVAILAISSFGAILIFDWYFFSVVDGVAADLRPVVGAFHPVGHDAHWARPSRAMQADSPKETPDQSGHRNSARLVPARANVDSKPSGN